eukprot:8447045-Alexandrium_andersonii.AAC.1
MQPPRPRRLPAPRHCEAHQSVPARRVGAKGCTASPLSPRSAVPARPRSPRPGGRGRPDP